MFMLAPRSLMALPQKESPMLQGTVKIIGSFSFGGNFPSTNWLHSCVNAIVVNYPTLLLFVNTSFINLEYFGIYLITFIKFKLMWSCFNISIQFSNGPSSFPLLILWGKEGEGLFCTNFCAGFFTGTSIDFSTEVKVMYRLIRIGCSLGKPFFFMFYQGCWYNDILIIFIFYITRSCAAISCGSLTLITSPFIIFSTS